MSDYELVIYGGTAAAVTAALEGTRSGLRTVLISPERRLGGMTTGGLGWTDSKNGDAIGGLAREFYHRIWRHYRNDGAWIWGDRASYPDRIRAQPGRTIDDEKEVMWTFEPKVAEKVFEDWLREEKVEVIRDEWLDRAAGARVEERRIRSIRLLSGKEFSSRMFVDATYEGDLMAAAGVSYRVGRDAAGEFDERINGIVFLNRPEDPFEGISPYGVPDDPASGFVAGIEGELRPDEKAGDADSRLQCFNYRLCLTDVPENRVSIERPENYSEADYELLFRLYEAGRPSGFSTQEMPNRKTDSNNFGRMGLDYVGGNYSIAENWNYSEAGYSLRRKIIQRHLDYTQGMLWTIMNHPRVPEEHRVKWRQYGLAADEFGATGHWPHQLYVREARRMQGHFRMTQHHVDRVEGYGIADSIGLGSYSLDSHTVRRVVDRGRIRLDGGFYEWRSNPYPISYGSILPKKSEMENLLVPVTLSATHAAFGSIRMEPTYMILGQSATAAASVAIRNQQALPEIPYDELKRRLLAVRQVLAW